MARNLRNLVPGSVVLLVGAAIGFLIGIAIETLIVFLLTAPPFVAFLGQHGLGSVANALQFLLHPFGYDIWGILASAIGGSWGISKAFHLWDRWQRSRSL